MNKLTEQRCTECKANELKLKTEEVKRYFSELTDWEIVEHEGMNKFRKEFSFATFSEALEFTNEVGRIAEEENHHPAVTTEWGKVTVLWWTHKIGGLHMNDLIMAAKCDELYS